jgi:hypothetical protein
MARHLPQLCFADPTAYPFANFVKKSSKPSRRAPRSVVGYLAISLTNWEATYWGANID